MTSELGGLIFTFLGWVIAAFFAGRNWFPIEKEYDEIRYLLIEVLRALNKHEIVAEVLGKEDNETEE